MRMPEAYEAPTVVHYGSVAALTASAFKCSGGSDAFYASQRTGIQDKDGGGAIYDPMTGEVIDQDPCQPFTLP
ncbi:MAG: lasso RiPP family leader peptide-containing protein [Dehalococcoidia bacterium]